jgi:hypothetical protein
VAIEDKFNINLNQNLWGLVVSYVALGVAEHWCLKWLFRLSLGVSIVMSVSILFTVLFYTWNYCHKRAKLE